MPHAPPEIVPCPVERRGEALSLVLCDIAPSQRRDIAASLLDSGAGQIELAGSGLFTAMRGEQLRGAAWGQRQPGNTAVFWPPQLVPAESEQTAYLLAAATVRELNRAAVGMAQVLLPAADSGHVDVIKTVGFSHLADLMYLAWETSQIAAPPIAGGELQFATYDQSQRDRLGALIERTYAGTLDCAALNDARSMDDVIDGYEATGVFRAENWLFVQHARQDIGVLILADHPQGRHWELVYMGLVPEARGRGWGQQITQHAQMLARQANVERIVLAVDAVNEPALRMYSLAGFQSWDKRCVYVRFSRQTASEHD
jgi:ribosomal protein S18 acetylase RimI-like enzyme